QVPSRDANFVASVLRQVNFFALSVAHHSNEEILSMTAAPDVASVFLLAENRLLREALTKIFERKSDLRVVGACAFSPAAVEQLALAAPSVLVLDSFAEGLHLEFLRVATRRANGAQPRSPHAAQSRRQQPAGGRRVVPHAGFTRLRAPVFHVRSSSHPQIAFAISIFSTQIDGQVNSPASSCF